MVLIFFLPVQLFQSKGRALVNSILRPIIAIKLWVKKCLGLVEQQAQISNNQKGVVGTHVMDRNSKPNEQKKKDKPQLLTLSNTVKLTRNNTRNMPA